MGFFSKIKDQYFSVGLFFFCLWSLKLNSTRLSGCANVYSRGFKKIIFLNIIYIIFFFGSKG